MTTMNIQDILHKKSVTTKYQLVLKLIKKATINLNRYPRLSGLDVE